MKTEAIIREEIRLKTLALSGKSKKKTLSNIGFYRDAILIVNSLSEEQVRSELDKVAKDLRATESLFEKYLAEFCLFRKKDPEKHRKAVLTAFKKEFAINKKKDRINHLEYILNIGKYGELHANIEQK